MPHDSARCQPLRNAQQFAAVMQQGQVVGRSRHFVLHALRWNDAAPEACKGAGPVQEAPVQAVGQPAAGSDARAWVFPAARGCYVGAIISKRWARRAVTRNLVKRQIRHIVPPSLAALPGNVAVVVRQRAAFDAQAFVSASSPALRMAVRQELLTLAQSANWQTLQVQPGPPRKPQRPVKARPKPHTPGASHPSGTMQPAP